MDLSEAREILEAITRSRHEDLVRSFEKCAVRYAQRQVRWVHAEPSTRLATIEGLKTDHDAFQHAGLVLGMEMKRSGEGNQLHQLIFSDRSELRDLACLIHCLIGMRTRTLLRGIVSPPLVTSTTCELHGDTLLEGEAKILYGFMPELPDEYIEAEERAFPLASRFTPGGCVSHEDQYRQVRYCPSCRMTEEAWRRGHPNIRFEGIT